jgi:hypothetical protein
MTTKKYISAQGRTVDLGALVLKNETVRAVGNMGVNARGDTVDSLDRPIESKAQQTRRHYDRQTKGNVTNNPVRKTKEDKKEN